jgi:hypothetical protein
MRTTRFIAVAALGVFLGSCERQADPTNQSDPSDLQDPPTATLTDATEIFRKAFWKSPGAEDRILHAERREWSDDQGVAKWQWFIVLHPSPELVKYVREDNAFGLVRLESPRPVEQAPAWFRFDPAEVEVMGAPRSNLQFIFSNSGNLLFAAHSGGGFTRGAAPPSPSAPPPPRHDGRLPRTPPPNPAAAGGSTSARGPGARSASPD